MELGELTGPQLPFSRLPPGPAERRGLRAEPSRPVQEAGDHAGPS